MTNIEFSDQELAITIAALMKLPGETGAYALLKRLEVIAEQVYVDKNKGTAPPLKMVSQA